MTLRQIMGRDAQRIHELVEELLDREDSFIVLIDRQRAITYASGFGLSACQQELASTDIERTVRALGPRIEPGDTAIGRRSHTAGPVVEWRGQLQRQVWNEFDVGPDRDAAT